MSKSIFPISKSVFTTVNSCKKQYRRYPYVCDYGC